MKFFGIVFLLMISISVEAQDLDLPPGTSLPKEEQTPIVDSEDNVLLPHNISIGVTLQNYRYEEPGLISHAGILIGAWLNWFYKVPAYESYTGNVLADLNTGRIDYDGAICDIETNQCNKYKAKTNDLLLRLSHRFAFDVTDSVQLFWGAGYRYLFDKGEGAGFYRRIGQYWILPIGFTARILWDDLKMNVVTDFEYDFFLKGHIESKLSDVNTTFSDVKHTQNKGRAWRFTLGFEPKETLDNPHPWMFYFFYETWSISRSDQVELMISGARSGNFFYEPENHSYTYGLRIGWPY